MEIVRRARVVALLAGVVGPASLACGPRPSAPPPAPLDQHATSAVGVITEQDIARQRAIRVEELLRGRVAGVEVIEVPGGEFSIRIRGTHSIYGSNEPLIVVDGMPIMSSGVRSALTGINPADVARIEVLKDAAATAFYGLRGANGVVVITTKR